jgi:hypothetical protein
MSELKLLYCIQRQKSSRNRVPSAILILECVVLPKWAEELPREGGGRMTGVESNECRVNRDPSTNWC